MDAEAALTDTVTKPAEFADPKYAEIGKKTFSRYGKRRYGQLDEYLCR